LLGEISICDGATAGCQRQTAVNDVTWRHVTHTHTHTHTHNVAAPSETSPD